MSTRERRPVIQTASEKPRKGHERIGQDEFFYAPHNFFNVVEQVRKKMDSETLENLVTSLIEYDKDGENPRVKVIQPITCVVFDFENARRYVETVNDVWGSEDDIADLEPIRVRGRTDDHFIIILAGHRRHLAAGIAADRIDQDPTTLDMPFFIAKDVKDYRDAIKIQYRENTHKQPEPWEDALAISAVLGDARKQGKYSSYAACARELGITEERVSRAYLFQTLPDFVKTSVRRDFISVGRALTLGKLYAVLAYDACKNYITDEQKERFLKDLAQKKLYLEDVMAHVREEDRVVLEDKFHAHFRKIAHEKELRTKSKTEEYVENTINDILRDVGEQMSFIATTEEQLLEEMRRKDRLEDRRLAVEALRKIATLLFSDNLRAERGHELAVARTPSIKSGLQALSESLDDLIKSGEDSSVITEEAAKLAQKIAAEVEDSAPEDTIDIFSAQAAA